MLWWVFREPRFEKYGMFAALGVGNQMIAVLPEIDLVIVNRANTYEGERTPMPELLDLIEEILEARTGEPPTTPRWCRWRPGPDPRLAAVSDPVDDFAGEWPYPPEPLGLPQRTTVNLKVDDGALVANSDSAGPSGSISSRTAPGSRRTATKTMFRFVIPRVRLPESQTATPSSGRRW